MSRENNMDRVTAKLSKQAIDNNQQLHPLLKMLMKGSISSQCANPVERATELLKDFCDFRSACARASAKTEPPHHHQ